MSGYDIAELPELLDRCLALSEPEREALLGKIEASAPHVAGELRRLLRADPTGRGIIEGIPASLIAAVLDPAAPAAPGQMGKYTVLGVLGTGGMGTVYLGYREDLNQHVALKIPRHIDPHGDRAEALMQEGRMLASLNHPNIANVFDWGRLPDGSLFIATEFINGRDIRGYCAEQGIGIDGRLRLIAQVAGALASAHANLIIHRDIKPGNILVDENGNPKVIDFGIARHLDAEQQAHEQTVDAPITPEYASPEQRLGRPLTVTSDVYSLGAVLYELLTGTKPFATGNTLPANDMTWRRSPVKASLQVAKNTGDTGDPAIHPGWARKLKGDIDTVLGKALAPLGKERYATADAFRDDLERLIAQRPISARPPGFFYIASKIARRNRVATAAVAGALMAMVVGVTFGISQWRTAVIEREQAIEARDDLRNYSMFLERLIKELDAYSGGDPNLSMGAFMARALERLKNTEKIDNERRAWFSNNLASVFGSWGDTTKALEALDEGLENAKKSATPHDEVSLLIEKALILDGAGRYEESIQAANQALSRIEEAPDTAWRRPYARMALAEAYIAAYRPLRAMEQMDRILQNPERRAIEKAFAAGIKADALASLHRYEQALEYLEKAYDGFLDYYGDGTVHTTYNHALILLNRVRIDPAAEVAMDTDELISAYQEVFNPGHPDHARLRAYIAEMMFLRGYVSRAIEYQREALKRMQDSNNPAIVELQRASIKLARYLMQNGQPTAAAGVLAETEASNESAIPGPLRAERLILQGGLAMIDGELKRAEALLQRAQSLLSETPYRHLLAESAFRRAMLAAMRQSWQRCEQLAANAAAAATEVYPATWSLPEIYADLEQNCAARMLGEHADATRVAKNWQNTPWRHDADLVMAQRQ